MLRPISLSIGGLQNRFGDLRALEIASEIGADAVDFDTCSRRFDYRNPDSVYARSDEEITAYFSALRARADALGITVGQTHGRIGGYSADETGNAAVVENARLDLLAARALGAPVCIIHSVSSLAMGADPDPAEMRRLNYEMYTRMLPHARAVGVKIAAETFGDAPKMGCLDFFGDIREFLMTFHRIAAVEDFAEHFTLCVDTGHSNKATRFGQPRPADTIRILGRQVTCLHLNDNDTLTDQHKLPLGGSIDWKDVLDALDEIGYRGNYNMELNLSHFGPDLMVDYAAFAVKVMRDMLRRRYGE